MKTNSENIAKNVNAWYCANCLKWFNPKNSDSGECIAWQDDDSFVRLRGKGKIITKKTHYCSEFLLKD